MTTTIWKERKQKFEPSFKTAQRRLHNFRYFFFDNSIDRVASTPLDQNEIAKAAEKTRRLCLS